MKNKILVVLALLLFSNVVFAETAELTNLIKNFYSAAEQKNADAILILYFYPEGVTDEFKLKEKQNIQTKIDREQLQGVEFAFASEEIFNQGKNAYTEINVTAGTLLDDSGTRIGLRKGTLYFVFEKKGASWKILNNNIPPELFAPAQKEEYVSDFKQTFFASIQQQGGFKSGYDGTNTNQGSGQGDQNAWVELFDSLIGVVSISIAIVVVLIIVFSVTGRGKDNKKQKEQKIVVSVRAGNQSAETPKEYAGQPKPETAMTMKEFSDAMKILRKRYASGEINKQQFDEMKKELEE